MKEADLLNNRLDFNFHYENLLIENYNKTIKTLDEKFERSKKRGFTELTTSDIEQYLNNTEYHIEMYNILYETYQKKYRSGHELYDIYWEISDEYKYIYIDYFTSEFYEECPDLIETFFNIARNHENLFYFISERNATIDWLKSKGYDINLKTENEIKKNNEIEIISSKKEQSEEIEDMKSDDEQFKRPNLIINEEIEYNIDAPIIRRERKDIIEIKPFEKISSSLLVTSTIDKFTEFLNIHKDISFLNEYDKEKRINKYFKNLIEDYIEEIETEFDFSETTPSDLIIKYLKSVPTKFNLKINFFEGMKLNNKLFSKSKRVRLLDDVDVAHYNQSYYTIFRCRSNHYIEVLQRKYLKYYVNKKIEIANLNSIENELSKFKNKSDSSQQQKALKLSDILENQNNLIPKVSINDVYCHFKVLTEETNKFGEFYLTNEQLLIFIKSTFIDKIPIKQELNCKSFNKKYIRKIFYQFYQNCKNKETNLTKLKRKYFSILDESLVGFNEIDYNDFNKT
ncbi:MAG: hypothetical protein A2046_12335 [Bacteroidetes bacterium GWA2_30_7]|nr:MAG: hypothetical protein A2046_12335 [Bacteroidetes bacterium GWA2_30_7]